jgi:hypothetical protein
VTLGAGNIFKEPASIEDLLNRPAGKKEKQNIKIKKMQ